MALACIPMPVRAFTEVPLKITSKGQRSKPTGLFQLEIARKARSMDEAHTSKLKGQLMLKISILDFDISLGLTSGKTLGTAETLGCMANEYFR